MTDEQDPKAEERVEDLDVPESESEDVKGGLLPANLQIGNKLSQKVSKIQISGSKISPDAGRFGDGSV
jgi:hypothetical protein